MSSTQNTHFKHSQRKITERLGYKFVVQIGFCKISGFNTVLLNGSVTFSSDSAGVGGVTRL